MKQLLTPSERRQLLAIEILRDQESWITLSELANLLKCSVRVLKDDVAYFKKNLEELTIESSNNGIRLVLRDKVALTTFYHRLLNHSTAYNALEQIFLQDGVTMTDLSERLSISSSTAYRLIDQINRVLQKEDFQIKTNPCRIEGSEGAIRHFFYNYFYEKYRMLKWPYPTLNEQAIDRLLQSTIAWMEMDVDFAFYNVLKTVFSVNTIRYQQGYLMDVAPVTVACDFFEKTPDKAPYREGVKFFEKIQAIKIDTVFIHQVLSPCLHKYFSFNYGQLLEKMEKNRQFFLEIDFLKSQLEALSEKHRLALRNKELVLLSAHNALHLEWFDPRSGFILDNSNKRFVLNIKKEFPIFYKSLYRVASHLQKIGNKPLTDTGINFMIAVIFTAWENLLPQLRQQGKKIHVLVVSDRHVTHSKMIQALLEYEFNEQITVEIYQEAQMNPAILKGLPYDIIVSNFSMPALRAPHIVYTEDLPLSGDLARIREAMDRILLERTP